MNRGEVRQKLWRELREMLLSDLEGDREVPQQISDFILENHGWAIDDNSDQESQDDLNAFVKNLQKWIEERHLLTHNSDEENVEEFEVDISSSFEKYLEAETEYSEVTSELVQVLEEVIKHKENYSNYFKTKCKFQEENIDILVGKSKFLKLQFFLKLYGEENALKGHLKLQQELRKELETLKKTYYELVERNKQYDEIKNDKNFLELFKLYKELRKIEKSREIFGEI